MTLSVLQPFVVVAVIYQFPVEVPNDRLNKVKNLKEKKNLYIYISNFNKVTKKTLTLRLFFLTSISELTAVGLF